MLFGKFDSTTGVYTFKERIFTPAFYANSIREANIKTLYNKCIEGFDSSRSNTPNWPKAVFVTYLPRWNEIKKSYEGLYAQSQLHYYDPNIPVGSIPSWALPWAQSGFALIHEYAPGEIAWLRDEANFDNEVYVFFDDYVEPAETPGSTPGTTPAPVITFKKLNISGSIGETPIDLELNFEE